MTERKLGTLYRLVISDGLDGNNWTWILISKLQSTLPSTHLRIECKV